MNEPIAGRVERAMRMTMMRGNWLLCGLLLALPWPSPGQTAGPGRAKSKPKPGNEPTMWVAEPLPDLPTGVTHHTYLSAAMGREVGFCLYLPPGYQKETARRYPVIYHLHGAGGHEARNLHNAEVLEAGIKEGRWPELILVFPNGGRATMYQDSGDGRFLAETTFIQELIPHIDANWRTQADRSGRCIEGFSMGGRGSTHLAMRHPHLFCSLFNQAGNVYRVSAPENLPNAYLGDDPARLRANDPYLNLKQNLEFIRAHLRIQIGCGTADPEHLVTVRQFHAELTLAGVPHDYFEMRGLGHNQREMIARKQNAWFDFHVASLQQNGADLHFLR